MSCITEILKLKGDQEVLLPLDKNGEPWVAVEGGGTYKNYEFLVTFTEMGHRCGYVAIPSNHKYATLEKKPRSYDESKIAYDWDEVAVDCHGGITFMSESHGLKNLLSAKCSDIWIGFDCAHCYDGKDMNLVEKYYGSDNKSVRFYKEYPQYLTERDETIREYSYVENECKRIIDQLIELEAA